MLNQSILNRLYKYLFMILIVTMFFSDWIIVKQGGILGQFGVLITLIYLGVVAIELIINKNALNFKNPLIISFFAFIIILGIGFFLTDLNVQSVYKGETPLIKFIKQIINFIIWGGVFSIVYHFANKFKSEFNLDSIIKFTIRLFYILLSVSIIEWVLYLIGKSYQIEFSKYFHHFYISPYKNVYSWLIGYPRFRFVEGEPVHGAFALEIFFIIFTLGLLKSKYKNYSWVSMILCALFGFLTFSRSGYMGIWLLLFLFTIYLVVYWKKINIRSFGKWIIILVFILQTVVTFPFINDSIYKYYQNKFSHELVGINNSPNSSDSSQIKVPLNENVSQDEISNNTRAISAFMSFDMVRKYPLFGVGWGLYGFHFKDFFPKYKDVSGQNWEFKMYQVGDNDGFWPEQHSFILRLISESGIIGTIAFIIMIIFVYLPILSHLKTIRNSTTSKITILLIIMSSVILMQFLVVMSGMNLLYLPFMLGLVYFISKNSKSLLLEGK